MIIEASSSTGSGNETNSISTIQQACDHPISPLVANAAPPCLPLEYKQSTLRLLMPPVVHS